MIVPTAVLIIPIDGIELPFKLMRSTVKSRRQKWTGYKRHSIKEVRRCLNTCSASLQEQ